MELLEDAFWEIAYSSFAHEDYVRTQRYTQLNTLPVTQNITTILPTKTEGSLPQPTTQPNIQPTNNYDHSSTAAHSEDSLLNTQTTPLYRFGLLNTEFVGDTPEGAYLNTKRLKHNYLCGSSVAHNSTSNCINTQPYTQVLDVFRPDFEEPVYGSDVVKDHTITYSNEVLGSTELDMRVTNPIKLRSTAKNAIVTHNAIQKVFKSRFDEGRSHARLQDISNTFVKHLFLNTNRVPYESLLGKNKESYFKSTCYSQEYINTFSDFTNTQNTLNTYFLELPFLVSNYSDSARYL